MQASVAERIVCVRCSFVLRLARRSARTGDLPRAARVSFPALLRHQQRRNAPLETKGSFHSVNSYEAGPGGSA